MDKSMMMKVIGVLLLVGVGFYAFSYFSKPHEEVTPPPVGTTDQQQSGTAAVASETAVTIQNFAFSPAEIRIKKGDTVTWTNQDGVGHTATSSTGAFDSGMLAKGQSFSFTFNETGTFDYICTPHPNMKGKVVVE